MSYWDKTSLSPPTSGKRPPQFTQGCPCFRSSPDKLTKCCVTRTDPSHTPATEPQKKALADILVENSKKLNLGLPIMVDPETRMDTSLAMGTQMHYRYTLVNVTADKFDAKVFLKVTEAQLIKSQRAVKNVAWFLKAGVEFYYIYFDKDGVMIGQIRLNKAVCGLE